MLCRDCKYMQEVGDSGLHKCVTAASQNFEEYTGFCCEDDCPDGKPLCENELNIETEC